MKHMYTKISSDFFFADGEELMAHRRRPLSRLQKLAKGLKGRSRVTRKGTLSRTETLSVRLDPRLKYLADIAARQQRQTVSSFIEWAIEAALDRARLDDSPGSTVAAEGIKLWDVDPSARFVKLASYYPTLLDSRERGLWNLIRNCPALWQEGAPNLGLLHRHWETLDAVSKGEADRSLLVPLGYESGEPRIKP